MWSLPVILVYVFAASSLAEAVLVKPKCPTVTSTAGVCKTCAVKKCIAISTISNPPGCPKPIHTKTTSYPCKGGKCPTGCAKTSYVYITPGPTFIPPKQKTCTPTVTVTTTLGVNAGCKFNCRNDFCISDNILTLPCDCTKAVGIVTKTRTVCATKSPCWNCHTGWMYTTTKTNCPQRTYRPE